MTSTIVQKKNNTIAWITTVVIHAVLLLLFLLIKYHVPAQIVIEEYGMEVNLGSDEDGFGDDQPENPNDPNIAMYNPALASKTSTNEADDGRDFHTDDAGIDNPTLYKSNEKPKQPSTRIIQEEKKRDKRNNNSALASNQQNAPATQTPQRRFGGISSAMNAGNNAQNSNPGGSEGRGTGNGDAGVPGGTPGASNYSGTPGRGSSSYSHNLGSRSIVQKPSNSAEFKVGGTVNVQVRVDRNGNVTVIGVTGSSNASLVGLAKQKVMAMKFNKDDNAPIEQKGTIVINFITGK